MRRDRIFISYRRADSSGHAGRLDEDLTRLLGSRIFIDVSDIAPGEEFEAVIRERLRCCGAVLALVGPHWLEAFQAARDEKDYVRLELAEALRDRSLTVVPVLVAGATLPAAPSLPEEIAALPSHQAATLRDDRWDDDVAHLARGLRTALGLSRFPRWLVPAVVGVAAAAAAAAWLLRPPTPSAFDRARAYDVTMEAARKAAVACSPPAGHDGECPVLLEFAPSGRVQQVYFDTGSCEFKGTAFGDCVLEKLGRARIPPFDDAATVQLEIGVRVASSGDVHVTVDE